MKTFSIAPRRPEDGDFSTPTWDEDVSLERYLEACPVEAETLGTFFAHVRQHVIDALGGLPDEFFAGVSKKSWLPFRTYPLRDFMRVAYAAARLVYPQLPRSDGLRRIGWRSYPSFASTMAGRVVLFALGDELDDVVRASPRAYRLGLVGCSVEVQKLGDRHYRYEMRDVHSFVDSYHYGVLEGAVLAFKHRPDIRIRRLDRLCDAQFEVRWT